MAGGYMSPGQQREAMETQKTVVELREQEGLGFKEIAKRLGKDVHTVWKHYHRAMRQIPAAAVADHAKKCAERLDEQLRRIDMERELLEEVAFGQHVQVSNGMVVRPIVGRDENGKPVYGEPIDDFGPVMAAIDRLHKLDDQEAKLLGMYPKQTISVERPTSEVDAAVISLIEQAKQRAAERRAAKAAQDAP